ncbi:hypothetical protein KC977_16780, partial [Proteus mirabilis]|uniref:hypothetical protein n=1 Tax=Proteus mirabilis TaxID=584 RepID=UPI0033160806
YETAIILLNSGTLPENKFLLSLAISQGNFDTNCVFPTPLLPINAYTLFFKIDLSLKLKVKS